jgi:hypothetical protein
MRRLSFFRVSRQKLGRNNACFNLRLVYCVPYRPSYLLAGYAPLMAASDRITAKQQNGSRDRRY